MRIDSCRNCGLKLKIKNICKFCKTPNQFICKKCDQLTDKQIHVECLETLTVP